MGHIKWMEAVPTSESSCYICGYRFDLGTVNIQGCPHDNRGQSHSMEKDPQTIAELLTLFIGNILTLSRSPTSMSLSDEDLQPRSL